jgi:hypothetical protein
VVTLRHEIATHILKTDPTFHAAHRTTILNVPATPTVLGSTEEEVDQQAVERQRRVTEWQDNQAWESSQVGSDEYDPQGKPPGITFEDHFYGNKVIVKDKVIVKGDRKVSVNDDRKVSVNNMSIGDDNKVVNDSKRLISDKVRVISDKIKVQAEGTQFKEQLGGLSRRNQQEGQYLPSTELTISGQGLTSGIDGFTPQKADQVSTKFQSVFSAQNTFSDPHHNPIMQPGVYGSYRPRFPTTQGLFQPLKGSIPTFASPSNRQFRTPTNT